jgi:O-antigen/teichoic acid export membrane protein
VQRVLVNKPLRAMIKPNFKSVVFRNTVWMLIGQGLQLVIQALYFVEIARSLGAANYGAFIGVVALVAIAFPFADLGNGNLLVRDVSRDRSSFAASWGRSILTSAVSGSVLVAVVLLASHFALPGTIPLRLILLVSVSDLFGLNIITNCGQAFQAVDRMQWTATISGLSSTGRLIGATVLIRIHPHPSPLQWGYLYLCSTAVVATIAIVLVCSKLGPPKMNWERSAADIREGLYFSTGLSAQTIYNDIDKTMLARLGTLEATGIYGAAYRLIAVAFIPASALLTATYANFFRKGSGGAGPCLAYAKPLLLRAVAYSTLAFVVLQLSAGVVPHILGGEYARSAEALRWLALLPLLKSVSYVFSNILTGSGHQGLRSSLQVGVALFNVLINLWIIPLYSWRGAAWSSLASDGILACGTCAAVFMIVRREKFGLRGVNAGAGALV